jgi:triosephosphate isomerase
MAPFEIVLNLKAYHESTLEKAQYLASELHSFLQGYTGENITLSLAPNIIDLQLLHYNFPTLRLIAPHVDAIKEGKQTGWVPASVFRRLGIETTILNHTEHRLSFSEMLDIIHRLKEVSMNVIVCCQSIEEAQELQKAEPYAIAFELPALIGSGKSIMHEMACWC